MRTFIVAVAIAAGLLFQSALVAPLAAQTTPPANLTQQQFDALVEAISTSVTEKLKAQGVPAAPADAAPAPAPAKPAASDSKGGKAGKPPPGPKIVKMPPKEGPDAFTVFFERAGAVVTATPVMLGELESIPGRIDRAAEGGRGVGRFLLLLGAIAVVALATEAMLRQVLVVPRRRLAAKVAPAFGWQSLGSLAAVAALDGLGVLVVWLVCHAAAGAWFTGGIPQDRFAIAVLTTIWQWRLFVLVFRIVLQPDMPAARLCAAGDDEARRLYRRISAVLLLMAAGRLLVGVLRAIDTPPEALASYQVMAAVIYLLAFLWLSFGAREAARQWFGGLGTLAPAIGLVGRHWIPVAPLFFAALSGTLAYGAISGRTHVGEAMGLTLGLVVAVLLFETFMQAFVRRLDSQLLGRTPASETPKLPDVVARCVRVAVLIGVLVVIAETWVVDVLGLVDESGWSELTRSSRTAAITLFVAFVAWELFKFATEPHMERKSKSAAEAIADGDAAAGPASRISTMMPLLRRAMAVLIILIAVMIALGDFGVDITPLIAGASVFGIAISFGSQTLVRDIVSGLFYLSDDAFRVGEYIDAGRAKGTVEGFTLRSIKLRHQNGQVHTIPFGQLGQITNFSRDWITVKFNLRFARDTDIEKLRKAAKKIGAEIAELPQFKDEILAPFKMQGVADIVENALLIRFKFTARPGNPAAIQREAVKRMFSALPALGIEFAKEGAAVVLQTGAQGDWVRPQPESAPTPAPASSTPPTGNPVPAVAAAT
ncbi:MAG: mechanosensitive ion channel family protein [Reyranella sp.]|jgi:small-conductance mechanosensitive channel|uniref:mechanosensitive ion channel family protein n=1 Tax=Reyranella sp. TaxID=1929291 RepID=UPI0025D1724F|nr:mechanosensitive ion channel family protein [Reyranella sp.]MBR2819095.1 mechanosensitive ion channel family protein [Reyranella sp.]